MCRTGSTQLSSSRTNTYRTHTSTQMTWGISGRAQGTGTAGARSQGPAWCEMAWALHHVTGETWAWALGAPSLPWSSVERLLWSWPLGCLCCHDRGSPSPPLGTQLKHHDARDLVRGMLPTPTRQARGHAVHCHGPHGGEWSMPLCLQEPRPCPRRCPPAPAPQAPTL